MNAIAAPLVAHRAPSAPLPPLPPELQALRDGYRRARAAGSGRHRDIAAALGVSEGELVAAHVRVEPGTGLSVRRLAPRWSAILKALPELGEVMALKNESELAEYAAGRATAVPIAYTTCEPGAAAPTRKPVFRRVSRHH